jgi:hypothetical protein
MTKTGFKSVTIPDSLYWVLSTTAKINKISISKVIEQGIIGVKPLSLNPTAVGSNPSQPACVFNFNKANQLIGILQENY